MIERSRPGGDDPGVSNVNTNRILSPLRNLNLNLGKMTVSVVLIIFLMPPSRSDKLLNDSKLFWSMFYLYKWKSKYNNRIKTFPLSSKEVLLLRTISQT